MSESFGSYLEIDPNISTREGEGFLKPRELPLNQEVIENHFMLMRPEIRQQLENLSSPELSPSLEFQLANWVNAKARISERRTGEPLTPEEAKKIALIYFKLARFVDTRNRRTDEIQSEPVQAIIAKKREMFGGVIPKSMICMDGRVFSKIYAGLHGNAYRTPAGDSSEFIQIEGNPKKLVMDPRGNFASLTDEAFVTEDLVVQCLDSHVGCAAKAKDVGHDHGGPTPDSGLFNDVVRKRAMAEAMREYTQQRFEGEKKMETIQTSFDPHSGYMYMGLEQDRLINNPELQTLGYTKEVLDHLVENGIIVSTEDLAENNPVINQLFQDHYFAINYEHDYVNSTVSFWENIERMSPVATEVIKEKLLVANPELSDESRAGELNRRTLLLLANAYGGYLHNHDSDGTKHHHYKYEKHTESIIVVTLSEKGPFESPIAFNIDPYTPNIDQALLLSDGIVRANRAKGEMSEAEKDAVEQLYEDPSLYVENPVIIVEFERLKTGFSKEIIAQLQQTDWSDIVDFEDRDGNDWMTTTESTFKEKYLESKIQDIPASIADKILELRRRAIRFYTFADPKIVKLQAEGKMVTSWWLTDHKRRNLVTFPFVTNRGSRYINKVTPKPKNSQPIG